MKRVVILGGGISGLSTAFFLNSMAREQRLEVHVTILEKETSLGGKMRTSREEGHIVEWGPNGFLTNKPDTLDMVRALGIENRLVASSDEARKRFLMLSGKLHKLPETPGNFLKSPIISPLGKFRIAMELLIPPRKDDDDETLADFVKRRLGKEALEKLIEPMASGVYAGVPENMSLKSCFPTIYALEREHGGLMRGMLAKAKERKARGDGALTAGPGGILTSFDEGVQTLVEETAANISANITTAFECREVGLLPDGRYRVRGTRGEGDHELEADALVVSTPAYSAASLLDNLDSTLSDILSSIPYAPIAVVAASFQKTGEEEKVDGFGYLVPRKENRKVLGVLFDSSIFPNRAPEGYMLLRGMLGGARNPEYALASEGKIVEFFLQELRESVGIAKDPSRIWFFRHERGIPQYTRDHQKKLSEIEERLEKLPGLFLNSNAYRGIGLNDCVRNSRQTAEKVLRHLSSR